MPITKSGEKNLVKALVAALGITQRQARDAVDENWMMIATAQDVDWRRVEPMLDTFDHSGENCVRLIFEDRMIATMRFAAGVLPQTVLQQAWAEYEAYLDEEEAKRPVRADGIPADIIEMFKAADPFFVDLVDEIAADNDREPLPLAA